jgi:DNA-binding response OmpR family regulator
MIEDDPDIAEALSYGLEKNDFRPISRSMEKKGFRHLWIDLILLP